MLVVRAERRKQLLRIVCVRRILANSLVLNFFDSLPRTQGSRDPVVSIHVWRRLAKDVDRA